MWRALVAAFVPVSPPIPKHIGPRILKSLHSRLVKTVEICFHVTELQVARVPFVNPVLNSSSDEVEPSGMTTLHPSFEPALDEKVAMYQLVQESGEDKAAVVFRILENRLGQYDESFETFTICSTS